MTECRYLTEDEVRKIIREELEAAAPKISVGIQSELARIVPIAIRTAQQRSL